MGWKVYGYMEPGDHYTHGPLPRKRWVKEKADKRYKLAYRWHYSQRGGDDNAAYNERCAIAYARWLNTEQEALDFLCALQTCNPKFVKIATSFGEGKARELDAARRAAIWPDASDAELSVETEQLKAALAKRHAALIANFRQDMFAAGFIWTDEDQPARETIPA